MDRKTWRRKRVAHREWARMRPDHNPLYERGYALDVAYSRSGCRAVRFTWLEHARLWRKYRDDKAHARTILKMVRDQRTGVHGTDLIETPRIFQKGW